MPQEDKAQGHKDFVADMKRIRSLINNQKAAV
jgi:hypothetical protein